jgi:hypothetical protein
VHEEEKQQELMNFDGNQPLQRSSRVRTPTRRMLTSVEQETLSLLISLQIMKQSLEVDFFLDFTHPMALAASGDPDTMYWDQALQQPDKEQFIQAALKEIIIHPEQGHWNLVPKEDVPKGIKVLDTKGSMKRKRRLTTNEVYKHKARLNVHGKQQELGVIYWETYNPVVTWASIRLLLILTLMYDWKTMQIDFVLEYPQAEVECDIYMRIPKDFTLKGKDRSTHVLKLVKNLYGQKQAGRIWNKYLHEKLVLLNWIQSSADECVYYKDSIVFLVYVDDGILISPKEDLLREELSSLQRTFTISVEGTLNDYVGVNITRTEDNAYHLSQPNIINSKLQELNFNDNTKPVLKSSASRLYLRLVVFLTLCNNTKV